ncbi:hypothetical protein ACFSSA_13635 [Luteolibacter algae]|uniref:Carbohydrate-binding domain-containing protein n=1 Tax=Luteolibacter algae TaxID=454151 RepID=A0ABW5D9T9_9BACT
MKIFNSPSLLSWGELDLPLFGLSSDWFGKPLDPPQGFALAMDSEQLWFIATRQSAAQTRPDAIPGAFVYGLWEYDVAELFIARPDSGEYLEFNLAANGAWWASKFSAIRMPAQNQPDFTGIITSYHQEDPSDSWLAALAIPLSFLKEAIGFGEESRINASFILGTPKRTFHSVNRLPGEQPDFHQPMAFSKVDLIDIPSF